MMRWLIIYLMLCLAGPADTQDANSKRKKKKAVATAELPVGGDAESDKIPRVMPIFEPGSHTQMIRALGFNADQSRLITVAEDASVQIWSTATGERLDILRLPSYGFESYSRASTWDSAAISPDGRYVAVGGGHRFGFSTGKHNSSCNLVLVDIKQRSVRAIEGFRQTITALAFSADHQLAVAARSGRKEAEITILPAAVVQGSQPRRHQEDFIIELPGVDQMVDFLAFSPNSKRLGAGTTRDLLTWDLSNAKPESMLKLNEARVITAIAWSPDSQQVAHAWRTFSASKPNGIAIHQMDGKLQSQYEFDSELGSKQRIRVHSLSFLNASDILLTCDESPDESRNGSTAIRVNLIAKTEKRVWATGEVGRHAVIGKVSPDKRLGAITISNGMDVAIYRIEDGGVVVNCGALSPVPTVVGWGSDQHPHQIGWSETMKSGVVNTVVEDLECAFDLTQMQMIGGWNADDFATGMFEHDEWKLRKSGANSLRLMHHGKEVSSFRNGNSVVAYSLVPQGTNPPLVAWVVNWIELNKSIIQLSKSDGTVLAVLTPYGTSVRDLVPSPDGRYILASMGTHRMCIFPTDGQTRPILSLARANGEWVAWNHLGYYAASPGGEKMFGWAETRGLEEFAEFHPVERFAQHFRRPDLLRKSLEFGSIEAALKQGEIRAVEIEQILPPNCELKLIKQSGTRLQLHASAVSSAKNKPIVAMSLLLDGRRLAGGVGQLKVAEGQPAETTWEIDLPAGSHELKLLVRTDDSSDVSEPLILRGPKSNSQQPVLHRLCVGINEYQLPALNLGSAAKDASDVFASLKENCVGPDNRFGAAKGVLLTNQQATRTAVLKAIDEIRRSAKPGDLVVILFAGHGIKQQDEFYLMTHEADPSEDLNGKSLSGADLRTALSEMECPVLLIMDACHSARGVKAFRPATDDLTRSLTDDTAGVTVLAAAMSHEVASATEENGHFTAAFLKALRLGKGVPYDPYDHVLYTHHVYSVVFSEVRKATSGKQNPFLNMPWTVPPLVLRDVPQSSYAEP